MNILLTNEYFYPFEPGGTEKSAFLLASGLVKAGHKVSMFTPNYGAEKRECIDGIKVIRYPFPKKLQQGERLRDLYIITPLFDIYMAFYLNKALKVIKPDIIHSQNTLSLSASVKAGLKNEIPVVHTVRDYGLLCPSSMCLINNTKIPPDCSRMLLWKTCSLQVMSPYEQLGFLRKLKIKMNHQLQLSTTNLRRKQIKKTAKMIFVSNSILNIYRKAFPFLPLDAEVVYNFDDKCTEKNDNNKRHILEKYGIKNKKLILIPGGLTLKKGTSVAIDAAKKILISYQNVVFMFPGRKEMPLNENNESVIFPGHLLADEINILYQASYAVVCPSIYPEPFGRTAIEAFSHSVPVVASNLGGYKEIVDNGVNGFLFEPGNTDELSNSLMTLLNDEKLRNKMGEEGLKKFEKEFLPQKSILKTLSVYQDAIKNI